MKRILLALLGIIAAYLIFYPAPIEPAALNWPEMEPHESTTMPAIEVLFPRTCQDCEDISVVDNYLYTGHGDGRLLRFPLAGGDRLTEMVQFEGRPLGLEVLGDSLAWVCVEQEGLARVDLRNRTYEIVVNSYNDTTFQLIDYLDVAADGDVYFTDASDKFSDDDLQYDVLEGRPNGALYRYNVASGTTDRLMDNLYFANGVVVAPDESYVLVAETAGFRIQKYWLSGPRAGSSEIFIEGLPGWPDGISLSSDGLIYVTLISPRIAMHNFILPRPWTRRLVTKLPKFFLPKPVKANRILALDNQGAIIHDWADDNPVFSSISSIERIGNTLYLGTLDEAGVGRISLK